jgi:hypothetical protein
MPKIGPLTPEQARRTIAVRLGSKADRLRQLATRVGIRPYRVFLVWQKWTGETRDEGRPVTLAELELLPTPKVESLDAVAINPISAGMIGMGAVRVSRVSIVQYTEDTLRGLTIPGLGHVDHIPEKIDFFYELREDGRGDNPAWRERYRLSTHPWRRAGKVDWTFMLERTGSDRDREGQNVIGQGVR